MKYQVEICISEGPNGPNRKMQTIKTTLSSDCPTEAIEEFAREISLGAAGCLGFEDPVAEYMVYNDELRVASGGRVVSLSLKERIAAYAAMMKKAKEKRSST